MDEFVREEPRLFSPADLAECLLYLFSNGYKAGWVNYISDYILDNENCNVEFTIRIKNRAVDEFTREESELFSPADLVECSLLHCTN